MRLERERLLTDWNSALLVHEKGKRDRRMQGSVSLGHAISCRMT